MIGSFPSMSFSVIELRLLLGMLEAWNVPASSYNLSCYLVNHSYRGFDLGSALSHRISASPMCLLSNVALICELSLYQFWLNLYLVFAGGSSMLLSKRILSSNSFWWLGASTSASMATGMCCRCKQLDFDFLLRHVEYFYNEAGDVSCRLRFFTSWGRWQLVLFLLEAELIRRRILQPENVSYHWKNLTTSS